MTETEQTINRGHAPASLWWAMCAGPVAWALDLGWSYVSAYHACSTGRYYELQVISAVCFVTALTGAFAAYSKYKELPRDLDDKGRRPLDRAYFQILFGFVFSIAFAVVVIAGAVPRWILTPCQ